MTDSTVYTVEGNTSSAAGVVSNGGCVREKSYPIGYASIAGYGRPAYDKEVTGNENVRKFQQYLNKNYNGGLVEDGEYGAKTKKAALKAMQMYLNKSLGARLAVDGVWGPKTVAVVTKCVLNRGDRGNAVYILQGMMYCAGYDPNGFDGIYGAGCQASVKKYQKAKGLSVDGVVGKQVWTALFA